jgi:hypothetical protein
VQGRAARHLASVQGDLFGAQASAREAIDHIEIARRIDARDDRCKLNALRAFELIRDHADDPREVKKLARVGHAYLLRSMELDELEGEHWQRHAHGHAVVASEYIRAGVRGLQGCLSPSDDGPEAA